MIWMRWLLVRWSLVSHFFVRIDFREKEFNWKASCKTVRNWWFCNPSKKYQSLKEKLFSPMSFDEKIMGGNKIDNLPIILEATLSLYVSIYYESLRRKYPPKSLFNDDGTSPEQFFFGRAWKIKRFKLCCCPSLSAYQWSSHMCFLSRILSIVGR